MVAADPADDRRVLQRIGDVRQDSLEQVRRLAERDRARRSSAALEADRDRLLEPPGAEQVVARGRPGGLIRRAASASAAREWIACRRGVDDVGVDRLLGQRVTPLVAPLAARVLLDELLGDRRLERRLHGRLVGAATASQRRVVEVRAEHGGGLERRDVLGVEAREPLSRIVSRTVSGIADRHRPPTD